MMKKDWFDSLWFGMGFATLAEIATSLAHLYITPIHVGWLVPHAPFIIQHGFFVLLQSTPDKP